MEKETEALMSEMMGKMGLWSFCHAAPKRQNSERPSPPAPSLSHTQLIFPFLRQVGGQPGRGRGGLVTRYPLTGRSGAKQGIWRPIPILVSPFTVCVALTSALPSTASVSPSENGHDVFQQLSYSCRENYIE